jgi:hypothetical protein
MTDRRRVQKKITKNFFLFVFVDSCILSKWIAVGLKNVHKMIQLDCKIIVKVRSHVKRINTQSFKTVKKISKL